MTDVTTFTVDEGLLISHSKSDLERKMKDCEVFSYHLYHTVDNAIIKEPVSQDNLALMVVAGGAIPSIINKELVHDIDVFILQSNVNLFERLITCKSGPWIVKWFVDVKADSRPEEYKNPNVLATATNKITNIQYILTKHQTRQDLLKDIDYLHATASYHMGKLYINRETFDAITKKHLIPQDKKKNASVWREEKFKARGWKSDLGESKSIKEILKDNLENLQKQSLDHWGNAAKNTNWYDNYDDLVKKKLMDAVSKGNTSYTLDDDIDKLLSSVDDPYLQTR